MEKLIAFHGKKEVKDFYLKRLEGHSWENGKGCAVSCTLENYSYLAYEKELGIPHILAKLKDRVFEGMNNVDAKEFPLKFLFSIPVGANLNDVYKKFLIWLLTDEEEGVIKYAKADLTKKSIQDVSNLIQKSLLEKITKEQFTELRDTADTTASVYVVAADHADYTSANTAVAAASYVVNAADYAATTAADYAAAVYTSATDKQLKYKKMADKLILLMSEAKVDL